MSLMFVSVQKILQNNVFLFCCHPVRSLVFTGVVVKSSSVRRLRNARQFVLELGVIDNKVEFVVRSGHESVDGYVAKDDQWFHVLSLSQWCVGCYEAASSGRCW
jgi:hypothetical protein